MFFRTVLAKWVVARFTQRLPPPFEDDPEGALAGAVPQKSFFVLQFDVEAVHLHRRLAGGAVGGDAGGLDRFVGHP